MFYVAKETTDYTLWYLECLKSCLSTICGRVSWSSSFMWTKMGSSRRRVMDAIMVEGKNILQISRLVNALSLGLTQKSGDSVYKCLSSHLTELHTEVIYNKGEKVYC